MNSEIYRGAVRAELQAHHSSLVSELTKRLCVPPKWQEAVLIEFTFHVADCARGSAPIFGYEVSRDLRYSPMAGERLNQILSSVTLISGRLDPMEVEGVDDACEIVIEEAGRLFISAWNNSGGREYHLPGFFAQHDDIDVFSLNEGDRASLPIDKNGFIIPEKLK